MGLYGGTAIIAIGADPLRLEPISQDYAAMSTWSSIYETLLYWDENDQPRPRLAESWDVSDDHKQITFHLVQNAKWHDGEPFTSEDVKFSFEDLLTTYCSYVVTFLKPNLVSIEAPDDYTVVFNLNSPLLDETYPFVHGLAGHIYPEHIWKSNPDPFSNPAATEPVGTGPYKFVEWERGDHVTLERFEDYWQEDIPYIDTLVFKVMPDSTARVLALERGEVNLIPLPFVPMPQFKRINSISGAKAGLLSMGVWPPYVPIYISAHPENQPNEALRNKLVRQAIGHAIDREAFAQRVWFALADPAFGPFSHPALKPFSSEKAESMYSATSNVEEANSLLDAAGYPEGPDGTRFTIEMDFFADRDYSARGAELFFEQMRRVGIDVKLNGLDSATLFDRLLTKFNYETHFGYIGGAPVKGVGGSVGLQGHYTGSIAPGEFERNLVHYSNPEYDSLYEQMYAEQDVDERQTLMERLQEIVVDESYVIQTTLYPSVYAIRDITNFPFEDQGINFQYMWLTTAQPTPMAGISMNIALIAAAVIVVVVAVVAIVAMRRKKP
jgi:peptide/nickel transport system substrate-binding protein